MLGDVRFVVKASLVCKKWNSRSKEITVLRYTGRLTSEWNAGVVRVFRNCTKVEELVLTAIEDNNSHGYCLLSSCSRRLKKLEYIGLNRTSMKTDFLDIICVLFPKLNTLKLRYNGRSNWAGSFASLHLFKALRHCTLSWLSADGTQLQDFISRCPSLESVHVIIKPSGTYRLKSNTLKSLKFQNYGKQTDKLIIDAPKLSYLGLVGVHDIDFDGRELVKLELISISAVHFRQMSKLVVVSYTGGLNSSLLTQLLRAIDCSPAIRRVTFHSDTPLESASIVDLFNKLHRVEYLELQGSFSKVFVDFPAEHGVSLARLKKFHFHVDLNDYCTNEWVLHFVVKNSPLLQKVNIELHGGDDRDKSSTRLKRLRELYPRIHFTMRRFSYTFKR